VRRFGAAQVGSFIVIAFASLALLHLVNPIKVSAPSGLTLSMVYAGASVLLLIGMGHTETVCRQREQIHLDHENQRTKLDSEARERAEELMRLKTEMAQEIVRLQQQLQISSAAERQYRLLFTQNPHPMWLFDLRSGRILAGNVAALTQYGFTQQEFSGLAAKDLLAREATEAFMADAAKPCSSLEGRGIWRHRRKDRSVLDVEVMATDLRFGDCPARLIFAEDIGPRLLREAELCEGQRMRILRRVAEGVAHHFGQILSVVEGKTNLVCEGRENPSEKEHLQQIVAETRRGSALIRQLLAVGACEGIQPESVDLNEFICAKESLLRRLLGERISLELHLVEGLQPVLVDSRTVEHIVLNLILNSRDAMPHGGTVSVHTEAAWVDNPQPNQEQSEQNAKSGPYVRLTVRDNGCGMSPEVQERIFEPFFTTREDDRAMGLGLATLYGVIKQHGGWIEFVSQIQHGTEFSVYLPGVQPVAQFAGPEVAGIMPESRETVLLVEANDRVRDLARHILERHGYSVIEADSPPTAVLLMEAQVKNVHLLLTNLHFPSGASGRELATQLLEMNPRIKVLYATAPLSSEDAEPGLLDQAELLLMPYTPDRLIQTVGSCFEAGTPAIS
jgi:two-component system cell cycle sensor histidine kinase/response regulator CckA